MDEELDEHSSSIRKAAEDAYNTFLETETIFLADCYGMGIESFELRSEIKKSIFRLRDALDSEKFREGIAGIYYDTFKDEFEENGYKFLYEIFNLVTMLVFFRKKYAIKESVAKKDMQKLINNLGISVIEGSHIGKSEQVDFNPYYISIEGKQQYSFARRKHLYCFEKAGNSVVREYFYDAQNTYLQHLILIMVVLYHRHGLWPDIGYSKIGQKHLILKEIFESSREKIPDNIFNNEHWFSNLSNVIRNFKEIMVHLKKRQMAGRDIKLANVYFATEFVSKFDYKELLTCYIDEEHAINTTIPSINNITHTISHMIEKIIKRKTNRTSHWKDAVAFMHALGYESIRDQEKYTDFVFDDGEIIRIYNDHGKSFGIDVPTRELHGELFETKIRIAGNDDEVLDNEIIFYDDDGEENFLIIRDKIIDSRTYVSNRYKITKRNNNDIAQEGLFIATYLHYFSH